MHTRSHTPDAPRITKARSLPSSPLKRQPRMKHKPPVHVRAVASSIARSFVIDDLSDATHKTPSPTAMQYSAASGETSSASAYYNNVLRSNVGTSEDQNTPLIHDEVKERQLPAERLPHSVGSLLPISETSTDTDARATVVSNQRPKSNASLRQRRSSASSHKKSKRNDMSNYKRKSTSDIPNFRFHNNETFESAAYYYNTAFEDEDEELASCATHACFPFASTVFRSHAAGCAALRQPPRGTSGRQTRSQSVKVGKTPSFPALRVRSPSHPVSFSGERATKIPVANDDVSLSHASPAAPCAASPVETPKVVDVDGNIGGRKEESDHNEAVVVVSSSIHSDTVGAEVPLNVPPPKVGDEDKFQRLQCPEELVPWESVVEEMNYGPGNADIGRTRLEVRTSPLFVFGCQ